MTMHLVIRLLGWRVLELELGLPGGDEPVDDESEAPDYLTGTVVQHDGSPVTLGFVSPACGLFGPGVGDEDL